MRKHESYLSAGATGEDGVGLSNVGYSAVPQSSQIGAAGGQVLVERTLETIRQLYAR